MPSPAELDHDLTADLPDDPLIGTVIDGKYQITRLLGAGGMGSVYEGYHRIIGKRIAVKVLHREFSSNADIVRRFQREARAAASIGHSHIVEVYDMGTIPGGGFFQVLELLDGKSLAEELRDAGPFSYARMVNIVAQIADALHATHEKGIVHRDLKPDNVFLIERDREPDFVKLLDFGIAKVLDTTSGSRTKTGMAIGTPSYMSPEQAQGQRDVDHRTDIYSLGVMAFELATGTRPIDAESYAVMLMRICTEPTPSLATLRDDVPEGLDAVIAKMTAKRKEERYASCLEVKEAIAPYAALAEAPKLAAKPSPLSSRSERETRLDGGQTRALEPTRTPTPVPEAVSGARPAAGSTSGSSATPAPLVEGAIPAAPEPARGASSARTIAIAAVAALALTVGVLAYAWPGGERDAPAPAPATASSEEPAASTDVPIAIQATPSGARLFIDGVEVSNPFVSTTATSPEPHLVEARLGGYVTAQRAITFREPLALELALTPDAPAAEPPSVEGGDGAPDPAPAASPAPSSDRPRRAAATSARATAVEATPATTPAAAPTAPPAASATPAAAEPAAPRAPTEPEGARRALKAVQF